MKGSITDQFGDQSGWRQGFFGDLLFRFRLFWHRQRVVDVLNQVEGALEALATTRAMRLNAVPGWLPREAAILAGAETDLLAAQETLRDLLFGTSADDETGCPACARCGAPVEGKDYPCPNGCAFEGNVVIDRGALTEIIVRPDGSVVDGEGRPLPKSAILTHRSNWKGLPV